MAMFEAIEDIWTKVRDFNEYSKALVTLATSVGAVVIILYTINILYKLFVAFRLYCLSQCQCLLKDYKKIYGQWAVISGSTDGIGLAMARDLARRGMSIIVIGRNEEKLANTKTSLQNEPNVGEVITVKIDLSDSSLENFAKIRSQIDPDNRDIGMLINNAGTFPGKFQRFNRNNIEDLKTIVNLNILATVYLTRMIMPGMLNRGKGVVINVSSILGSIPAPYMATYGATKAFVDAFSHQLQVEYADHPVSIVNLTPGGVHTKLFTRTSKMSKPTIMSPTPEYYARVSLNALGAGFKNFAGTAAHAYTHYVGDIFDCLGLVPFFFRINMRLNAREYELSPIMKRKKTPAQSSDQGNDEVRQNLSSNNEN